MWLPVYFIIIVYRQRFCHITREIPHVSSNYCLDSLGCLNSLLSFLFLKGNVSFCSRVRSMWSAVRIVKFCCPMISPSAVCMPTSLSLSRSVTLCCIMLTKQRASSMKRCLSPLILWMLLYILPLSFLYSTYQTTVRGVLRLENMNSTVFVLYCQKHYLNFSSNMQKSFGFLSLSIYIS